jgi:hypothetical protein
VHVATSTNRAFFVQVDYFGVPRDSGAIPTVCTARHHSDKG